LEVSVELSILPSKLLANITEPHAMIDSPKKFLLFNRGLPSVQQ
jgi:hypothetical protein